MINYEHIDDRRPTLYPSSFGIVKHWVLPSPVPLGRVTHFKLCSGQKLLALPYPHLIL